MCSNLEAKEDGFSGLGVIGEFSRASIINHALSNRQLNSISLLLFSLRNALDWSYSTGLQYGWIPQDLDAKPYGDNICTGVSRILEDALLIWTLPSLASPLLDLYRML